MPSPPKLFLDNAQALEKIASTPGLIPVDVGADGLLTWRDIGRYHPYEGFFIKSLSTVDALQSLRRPDRPIEYYRTPLDVLAAEGLPMDSIPPTGFIFIIGRCGSTLLAKALARSRCNLVISEAMAHNGIWAALAPGGPDELAFTERNLALYRRLVLSMARRRLPQHRYHFIKFSGVNVLFARFIMQAFPQTPALFLYRAPEEVLVSFLTGKPAWVRQRRAIWRRAVPGLEDNPAPDDAGFIAAVLQHCMTLMLEGDFPRLKLLDYARLTERNLPDILRHFGADYPQHERGQMARPFRAYSKNDYRNEPFHPDRDRKRQSLTPAMAQLVDSRLAPLFHRLQASDRNLIKEFSL